MYQLFFLFVPFFVFFSFSFPIVLSSPCKGLVAFSAITSAIVSVLVVASAVKLSSLCMELVSAITSAGVSVVGVPEITSEVVSLVAVLGFYGRSQDVLLHFGTILRERWNYCGA